MSQVPRLRPKRDRDQLRSFITRVRLCTPITGLPREYYCECMWLVVARSRRSVHPLLPHSCRDDVLACLLFLRVLPLPQPGPQRPPPPSPISAVQPHHLHRQRCPRSSHCRARQRARVEPAPTRAAAVAGVAGVAGRARVRAGEEGARGRARGRGGVGCEARQGRARTQVN